MKFEELLKERQDEIIEANREINTTFDWWKDSLENITEKINEKININLNGDDLMFDFFSKGKSGVWIDRDVLFSSLNEKYPRLDDLDIRKDFGVWAYMGLRRDDTDGDIEFEREYEDDEDLADLLRARQDEEDKEKVREDLEYILDIFVEGYNSLYKEYDYLTSDEGIVETIKANELEFEDED